jgi:hypothetical protein
MTEAAERVNVRREQSRVYQFNTVPVLDARRRGLKKPFQSGKQQ